MGLENVNLWKTTEHLKKQITPDQMRLLLILFTIVFFGCSQADSNKSTNEQSINWI